VGEIQNHTAAGYTFEESKAQDVCWGEGQAIENSESPVEEGQGAGEEYAVNAT
jgi:hypothetical protein